MANMSSHYVNVDSFRPAKLHDGSMRHQLDMGVFLLPMALATALSYYAVRILLFLSAFKAQGHDKAPKAPRIPRTVVTFGGILVTFLRTPLAFLLSARYFSDYPHPIRLRVLFKDVYFNQGPANVAALFRNKTLSGFFMHSEILYSCFGLSRQALKAYKRDDSGPYANPYPGTNVEARNRLEYRTFISHHQFLIGSGFAPLCKRFEKSIASHFNAFRSGISGDWVHGEDFMHVFKHTLLAPALIDSVVGPALLERDPDFLANFWTIDDNVWSLTSRLPKFLIPKPHVALNKCLAAVKEWHAWAKEHSDPTATTVDSGEDDAYWGSKFVRERQVLFSTIDGQNQDTIASQDLGFLWGSNHNTVTSAFWLFADVFLRPELLQRIRKEAGSCQIESPERGLPKFDMERLQRQPYAQAVYAETLRLRTHGVILRQPSQDLQLNEWSIPKGSPVVTSSTTAHMNAAVWSAPQRGSRPATEFYPERFFLPKSESAEPEFSMSGTDGSWVPFGGGVHACPGRRFVKYETILTLAILVTVFDIEILASRKDLEMSERRFGFGVLEPRGRVPFRIRARASV